MSLKNTYFPLITFLFTHSKIGLFHEASFLEVVLLCCSFFVCYHHVRGHRQKVDCICKG